MGTKKNNRSLKSIFGAILISWLAFLPSTAQPLTGSTWAETKSAGKGSLVVVYYRTPGLIYKNADGKMSGVCVEILKDFIQYVDQKHEKSVNVKFFKEEKIWSKFLDDVKTSSGGVLGIANTTITAQRKRKLQFTPSYMSNPMVLLTHKNVESITSMDEIPEKFKGFKAVMIDGSTHIDYVKAIKKIHYNDLDIQYAKNGQIILNKLATDQKAFTVLDFTEYYDAVKRKFPIKKHAVKVGKTNEELGIIMPLNSDWGPLWDAFYNTGYKNSPKYKDIVAKNLGKQFTYLID